MKYDTAEVYANYHYSTRVYWRLVILELIY